MIYQVGVRRSFKASHRLIGGDWGGENELHEHPYEVEVSMKGTRLDEQGYVIDITKLEASLDTVLSRIAGKNLNDLPELSGLNPSVERLAELFCKVIIADISFPALSSVSVKVFESGSAWAACHLQPA